MPLGATGEPRVLCWSILLTIPSFYVFILRFEGFPAISTVNIVYFPLPFHLFTKVIKCILPLSHWDVLNSKSFESSEGANKCYNSKFVLWICTSYQLNGSKASTFIVYFSQLCVFNSLVQTMIKTRCAHGHWSPEWTWSLHIVTHGVTKQEDACSHCLTPSHPPGTTHSMATVANAPLTRVQQRTGAELNRVTLLK